MGLDHQEQSGQGRFVSNHIASDHEPAYLSEHYKGLLNPGEDLEGDVGGPALGEGVLVRDNQTLSCCPLPDLVLAKCWMKTDSLMVSSLYLLHSLSF